MLKRLLAVSLCSLFAVPAWAGNVSLFPTSIVAPAGEKSGALTLKTTGTAPSAFR